MDSTVKEFLLSTNRNMWCREGEVEVYVRRAQRMIRPQNSASFMVRALDIATLRTERPGSGRLSELFDHWEQLADDFNYGVVFVENVINPRLVKWLERRGYEKQDNPCDPGDQLPCFYKQVDSIPRDRQTSA